MAIHYSQEYYVIINISITKTYTHTHTHTAVLSCVKIFKYSKYMLSKPLLEQPTATNRPTIDNHFDPVKAVLYIVYTLFVYIKKLNQCIKYILSLKKKLGKEMANKDSIKIGTVYQFLSSSSSSS